jgi:transcriptional regulator with XRE-family HTH domain
LDLSSVQQKLSPGLEAALDETLSYHEITQLCQLTLVNVAIQREGNQERAARKLGVAPATITQMLNGKTHRRRGPKSLLEKAAEVK